MQPKPSFANIPTASLYQKRRSKMIEVLQSRHITDQRVLQAMREIPRHLFVPEALASNAYGDHALPIGQMQTISQPFMVALMTQILEVTSESKILEIGAGSGYQTAILALLGESVFAIERLAELASSTQARLAKLGFQNVNLQCFDGTLGWPEHAPYDRILIAAGGPAVPSPLLAQLKIGGRFVAPIGDEKSQTLLRITRTHSGMQREEFGACQFVKLIGQHGWNR